MESTANQSWFLRKYEDGSVFGPLPFEQVRRWAAAAQVAPHDKLSHDQQTWLKAPMFPELEMDWLVEVTSDRYYGPTTLSAVRDFVRLGEINQETFVINSCDGARRQIKNSPACYPCLTSGTMSGAARKEPPLPRLRPWRSICAAGSAIWNRVSLKSGARCGNPKSVIVSWKSASMICCKSSR